MRFLVQIEIEAETPERARTCVSRLKEMRGTMEPVVQMGAVAIFGVKGPAPLSMKTGSDEPDVIVYTDGACVGNPGGPGGWGFVIPLPIGADERCGGEAEATNNRMELMAAIRALEHIEPGRSIVLYTDSRYVKNGITSWIHGWRKKGWRTVSGSPVKNAELWRRLDIACARHQGRVRWKWVKGHAGNRHNERADRLANEGMRPFLHSGEATA